MVDVAALASRPFSFASTVDPFAGRIRGPEVARNPVLLGLRALRAPVPA